MRQIPFVFFIVTFSLQSQVAKLQTDPSGRFLQTSDGAPFFWLADTAWELFHRCDREEADLYLRKRAEQGFNVIQAVALAEIDGLNTPNPYGEVPLAGNDPQQPNTAYFEHVDYIIDRAASLGMYIALLPTWGDKLFRESWGVGPEIFNPENAYVYGKWIGDRYKDRKNIIWIIGGDRNPREGTSDVEVWNQMALGICKGIGGCDQALMSFHPQPKADGGSSTWFHEAAWLDFNMHQTGHCANQGTYHHIIHDYGLQPVKPVLDGEPLYEDHPNCFNAQELGHSVPSDIRRIMYWNVFAGAFGQSYGCHDVWQMYLPGREPINQPLRPWKQALDLPVANQVRHLKNLMLSRPYYSRIPDQEMVPGEHQEMEYVSATRDAGGRYAMIYFPEGGSMQLDLSSMAGKQLKTWWFDPRTGNSYQAAPVARSGNFEIAAPTRGKGHDWVLVLDSEDFGKPGE